MEVVPQRIEAARQRERPIRFTGNERGRTDNESGVSFDAVGDRTEGGAAEVRSP